MPSPNKTIKALLLKVDNVVICEVVELEVELGEHDCKIIKPYEYVDGNLVTWPEVSGQNELGLRSEDILTVVDPTQEINDQYLKLTSLT